MPLVYAAPFCAMFFFRKSGSVRVGERRGGDAEKGCNAVLLLLFFCKSSVGGVARWCVWCVL